MNKVKIGSGSVQVSFNDKFYPEEAIDEAINHFSEISEVSRTKNVIEIKPKYLGDLKLIGYEFYNRVLEIMKN